MNILFDIYKMNDYMLELHQQLVKERHMTDAMAMKCIKFLVHLCRGSFNDLHWLNNIEMWTLKNDTYKLESIVSVLSLDMHQDLYRCICKIYYDEYLNFQFNI